MVLGYCSHQGPDGAENWCAHTQRCSEPACTVLGQNSMLAFLGWPQLLLLPWCQRCTPWIPDDFNQRQLVLLAKLYAFSIAKALGRLLWPWQGCKPVLLPSALVCWWLAPQHVHIQQIVARLYYMYGLIEPKAFQPQLCFQGFTRLLHTGTGRVCWLRGKGIADSHGG
jgi:hypothetical protein